MHGDPAGAARRPARGDGPPREVDICFLLFPPVTITPDGGVGGGLIVYHGSTRVPRAVVCTEMILPRFTSRSEEAVQKGVFEGERVVEVDLY